MAISDDRARWIFWLWMNKVISQDLYYLLVYLSCTCTMSSLWLPIKFSSLTAEAEKLITLLESEHISFYHRRRQPAKLGTLYQYPSNYNYAPVYVRSEPSAKRGKPSVTHWKTALKTQQISHTSPRYSFKFSIHVYFKCFSLLNLINVSKQMTDYLNLQFLMLLHSSIITHYVSSRSSITPWFHMGDSINSHLTLFFM